MYALPTVIGDHGVHHLIFGLLILTAITPRIKKKPLMYMLNFYFSDKDRNFFNCHMIDSVNVKEPSFFKYV